MGGLRRIAPVSPVAFGPVKMANGDVKIRLGMDERYVFDFSEGTDLGRELLGGKGIGLAEMTAIGIPVPDRLHRHHRCLHRLHARRQADSRRPRAGGRRAHGAAGADDRQAVRRPQDPLLVSVRSGAAVSMPGMMDTILNLGLNDEAVEGLARATENPRFAYDAYRRLIQMYGDVVAGVDAHRFEEAIGRAEGAARGRTGRRSHRRRPRGARRDASSTCTCRSRARTSPRTLATSSPPRSARSSTRGTRRGRRSTGARTAFRTTSAPRSTSSRWSSETRGRTRAPGLPSRATRRPASAGPWGEFLANAQGEDVVAGDPHAGADRGDGEGLPRSARRARRDDAPAGGSLPRDAGHRVHDRGGPALSPPDPEREAYGAIGTPDRRRHGRGGAHLQGGGDRADRPQAARPAAPPDDRPEGRLRGRGQGPERVARRGDRKGRPRRRHRGGSRQAWGGHHPRPLGDDSRRHPRPPRGARRAHRAGRHDLARRGRRPRHGQALRGRVRGADHRSGQAQAEDRRPASSPRAT